jgi:hypothetical protein
MKEAVFTQVAFVSKLVLYTEVENCFVIFPLNSAKTLKQREWLANSETEENPEIAVAQSTIFLY